ncbi:MAG: gliding motility protein GldM, partial [Bacteroidota bacterium]|nr:gliding motility protein GldM [Bacteroidota bacterium]
MALPKEPRQKMINLMYLVLTALLALNVSSEILNAFKTVNNSLNNATNTIEDKNKTMFASLNDMKNDPKTREKASIWAPKADKARQVSDQMNTYIINLQEKLKKEADLDTATGKYNEGSLEAATRLMDEQGEGEKLKNALTKFKNDLLGIDPAIAKEFAHTLPIDVSMPKVENPSNNTWSAAYFRMTPTIAAMTILSKFQNDVKNSESQVVEYCTNQIGSVKVVYNQFQAFAGQSSQYLMPGQELQITAGIGAFSSEAKPTVSIDGSTVPIGPDGAATYKTTVGGAGSYTKKVHITFLKPDGTQGAVDKEISYTVGSPTGASVSADAVKVLYIGLDNPVSVSGGNVGDEKVSFSMDNGTFTKDRPGHYIVRPGKPGTADITLNIEGKAQQFPFRVKSVPDPIAMIGASKGGIMGVNEFKAQQGVRAELENFVFEGVKFTVTGYTIAVTGPGFPEGFAYRDVSGNTFNSIRDLIEKCRPKTNVTIDNIRVSGPGGS